MTRSRATTPRPPCRGFAVTGGLMLAALSAIALIAGCHATPTVAAGLASAPACTPGAQAAAALPRAMPFDEQFVVLPQEAPDAR